MRKTRKFPFMFGSIRKRKKADRDYKAAIHIESFVRRYCPDCVSELICIIV